MAVYNKKNAHSNPLLRAGIINKIFFWWLKDIIWYGKMYDLGADDLYDTVSEDLSEPLRYDLEKAWKKELNDACVHERKPNLWKVIIKTYWWDFMKSSTLPAGFSIITIVQPELLQVMMSYFRSMSPMTAQWAYFNATLFVVLTILRTVLFSHSLFQLYRLGMHVRIACSSLIYKKMIRLSSSSRNTRISVISLLSVDVARLEILFAFTPYIPIVPIQLLIVTYLIWRYVGINAALIGIVLMIFLSLPIQVLYSKVTFKLRTKQTSRTDNRIILISEIIHGIRAVKMYVWEKYFVELVRLARRLEIRGFTKISYFTSVVWSLTTFCHRLCVFAVILTYVSQYDTITTHTVLPVTQHFYNLRLSIIILFFYGVRNITDMRVSMKRIENFLLLQEVNSSIERIADESSDVIILIDNVTASWDEKWHVIENINLNFAPKHLYAVVGSIGSGKSSLLKLILGELPLISGTLSMYGKISYASQEPWLFPGSIRDNILFGEIYDERRYDEVVRACALLEDFDQLPCGDQTWVGERGINLSGGQCARINLARAVYRNADIYLLDNPLSAVDSRVAKKLMKECINGLLKNSTRIVVTPNLQQFSDVDEIILLDLGKVEFKGSMEEFQKRYHHLQRFPSNATTTSEKSLSELQLPDTNLITESFDINDKKEESKETAELIAKGAMEMSIYSRYINAGGFYYVILIILFNCFFVVSVAMFDLGLAAWNQKRNVIQRNETEDNIIFLGNGSQLELSFKENSTLILGGLILLVISTSFLVNLSFYRFALNASSKIHNSMFSQLMKTTLRFFELNPSDRILNRFSEDTSITDNVLPLALFETMQAVFQAIALLLSAIIVNWWIAIPGSISIFIFIMLSRLYVTTIQKIKRLVGNAKSPVLAFTASSLAGLTTIRACKAEDIVSRDFDSRQDHHTEAQFLSLASVSAISLWIELINLGLLASVVYICVILKNDKTFEGYVGLSLMQIFNMTMIMSFLVKRFAEAFANMTSVERMLQFTHLEQEELREEELNLKLPSSWPDKGEIKFQQLYLRYLPDGNPVLWDLNFTIKSGSKIGVVGRTGAGKSSLISALFRLAKIEGSLLIDGIDIKKIDLPKLRSKLSIIPQESAIFSATLRKNLDPFNEFDDAVLWSALEDVNLKQIFDSLDYFIGHGGSNLSLGQRQLLCLARTLIKKNKILILDEATANVDSMTDALIQKMIRTKFKECTVITMAHRLNTVMDSDMILVLDNGRVVEYDHPYLLLQNNYGYLFKMIEETGNAMMQHLITMAEQAYHRR
ncbi:ATP-binding cassette sub-family C member 4-like [Phymastichus coffea]|uniref:ATP-binding cassette sub-family C member 4-like n=1 Tax=Phymastichus coffea TaxID=108790 RepID=UPI00273B1F97|nr:ATP-binding cassette sub-family C member 4-like [Phymastichus coffea]XP_058809454.1 ATP-binding cassette sub-family C member 4-like [Phymastichus coffea]